MYWALHCREAAEKDFAVQKAMFKFLASKNKRDSMLKIAPARFMTGQTLLHVIAKNGLVTICGLVLDMQQPERAFGFGDLFSFLKKSIYGLKEAAHEWLYPSQVRRCTPERYLLDSHY
jgi:hypothetical protein